MGNKGSCPLPRHTSDIQLASDFSNFFTSKVSTIRESLNHVDTSNFVSPLDDDAPATLHSFSPTTIEEIVRIIKLSPNKSCGLLKSCAQELAPIITAIVNRSFETSCMPTELKRAHVRPRLKKSFLDPDLIERLQKSFGISGDALTWVVSYLRWRNQQVLIGDTASAEVVIEYGVPQGSVLGPKLYSLYTKPLADVIRYHQLDMHFYADDTQLHVSFENNAPEQQSIAVTRLNTCIGDIRN